MKTSTQTNVAVTKNIVLLIKNEVKSFCVCNRIRTFAFTASFLAFILLSSLTLCLRGKFLAVQVRSSCSRKKNRIFLVLTTLIVKVCLRLQTSPNSCEQHSGQS